MVVYELVFVEVSCPSEEVSRIVEALRFSQLWSAEELRQGLDVPLDVDSHLEDPGALQNLKQELQLADHDSFGVLEATIAFKVAQVPQFV